MQRKVPEIIALFWVIKLLTTAMGEVTSDSLVRTLNPYLAVGIGAVGLCIALAIQFKVQKYVAWIYWFAVIMVAIFGTMAADVLHVELHIPYLISTIVFLGTLLIVFYVWYRIEHTLSIHSITTFRRECFYWITVMATFACGTAVGDLTATTFHLGYFASGVLFLIGISFPFAWKMFFNTHEVITFWSAYILTRPLGASFADWIGKPVSVGGIGVGDIQVSLILTVCIILCVGYIGITKADTSH